jgi:hypothetical protein
MIFLRIPLENNHLYKPKSQNSDMEEKVKHQINQPIKRIKRISGWNASTTIIVILLGIVTVLSIMAVLIIFEFIIALMTSLMFLLVLMLIIILITKPKRRIEIVYKNVPLRPLSQKENNIENDNPEDEEDKKSNQTQNNKYIGSKENKKYHKTECRYAKNIKPEYAEYNSEESYFKKNKYKPCKICIKK